MRRENGWARRKREQYKGKHNFIIALTLEKENLRGNNWHNFGMISAELYLVTHSLFE
ncbi:hypothetical protein Mapa_014753 [Marchantia paleacea]|nr:hypothetical protein Mapa_014753 [Marchantia paleacea]